MPIRRVQPASCELRCRNCFVFNSCRTTELSEKAVRRLRTRLPAGCRDCPSAIDGTMVCWGAICSMRNCCRNCGLGYALQCRRHPCRKFFKPDSE